MKKFVFTFLALWLAATCRGQITLDGCQAAAQQNYPLISRYELIRQSEQYTLSNARRAYLPQFSVGLQASYQSDVTQFPDKMLAAYSAMGIDFKGINHDQYRAQIDLTQTIWDGGAVKAKVAATKAESAVSEGTLDVDMYAVRERINSLYFGILSLDAQAAQNGELQTVLEANCNKLDACVRQGVALQSDVDAVRADLLTARQQQVRIQSTREAYIMMLSVFTAIKMDSDTPLVKPTAESIAGDNINRPELQLLDARIAQLDTRRTALNATVTPRIMAFAQGFYGNPGLNLFKDMTENRWTLNGIAGIKVQWNIGAFYTKRQSMLDIKVAQQSIELQRDVFMMNTSTQVIRLRKAIEQMHTIMQQDNDIIELRASVRRAAESKLANGIIDVSTLLTHITAENQARIARSAHEIELLKNIYDLKYVTND